MSTYKYSYPWSENVVQEFLEKYARGTKFLSKMLGVSETRIRKHAIAVLRTGNSLRWETFKRSVKVMEHEKARDYRTLSYADRQKYITFVKYFAQDDSIDEKSGAQGLDSLRQNELGF